MSFKIYFFLFLAAAAVTCDAAIVDAPASRGELAQTQQQVQKLENDLVIHQGTLQARFDANDKRISDFGVLVTMQGTHSTWVGNLVAMTSIGITILVFVASLVTYLSATARAKSEARDAAQEWFSHKATALRETIVNLELEAATARMAVAKLKQEAEIEIAKHMRSFVERAAAAANEIMVNVATVIGQPVEQAFVDPVVANSIQQVSDELKTRPDIAHSAFGHYVRGAALFAKGQLQSALDAFEVTLRLAPAAESSEKIRYLFAKGITLNKLKRVDEAISVYDEIDRLYCFDRTPAVREEVARVLLNKGQSLVESNRLNEALAVYELLIERYRKDDALFIREQVASAMVNRGIMLGKLGRPFDQIAAYDVVDASYGKDDADGLRERVAASLLNKAITLMELGKEVEALEVCDAIDNRYQNDKATALREHVVKALDNKGVTLGRAGKLAEAINVFEAIEARYAMDENPGIRARLANALSNKGCALRELGDYEGEISAYNAVYDRFAADKSPEMRQQVAKTLYNKGVALGERAKKEGEANLHDKGGDRLFGSIESRAGSAELPISHSTTGAAALNIESSPNDQIEIYEFIVERYGSDDAPAVREEVAKALNGHGLTKIMHAKQCYKMDEARHLALLSEALLSLNRSLAICSIGLRAFVYGNLGYVQFLAGQNEDAIAFTRQCLHLGGSEMLAAQRADARAYRIESIDSRYEKLLNSVWIELGAT